MYQKPNTAFIVLLVMLTAPLSAILQGVAIRYLWGLYVTPIFGIETPRLVLCIGFALLFAYLANPMGTGNGSSDSEKTGRSPYYPVIHAVSKSIVNPLVLMLFGWLYSLFL
jgi:hypothetical protein